MMTQTDNLSLNWGDRIFVRISDGRSAVRTLAEFSLSNAKTMSDIYGAIRRHTTGVSGLTRLYVRNATRGWSLNQPYMMRQGLKRSLLR